MKIGMVGLGRMGMNMARRLLKSSHEIVAYNRTPIKTDELAREGAQAAYSLEELIDRLERPRVVWLMLPAGPIIDEHIERLIGLLEPEDIVIDGANSHYKDSIRRGKNLQEAGFVFIDAGVSGGIWGLRVGYCLMVGGPEKICQMLEPVFTALAPPDGYLHCGPTGAGHFIKMIHNGIEYGMMQAYGEGFALVEASPYGETVNMADLAHLWNQGSVIRSWLLELAEDAFRKDPKLEDLEAWVADSGEGRWTVQASVDLAVPTPVLSLALMERFRSRRPDNFSDRVLAALRREFGGHAVKAATDKDS